METQNIEYKESWRDEYLKWICGFANAQGGTLYIGMNDKGEVVGVDNAKRLLEDIPNKVKNAMGIIVGVDLMTEDGKSYIRIETEPCGFPLNYKGDYYIRSGATLQTLQGSALTHFLLKRTGTKWDSVTVDNFTYQDLDRESFNIFRREALRSKRMTEDDLACSDEELLERLKLTVDGKLKRAAVLLFYREPEELVTGCYTKIGMFNKEADILYMDEVHGSLMMQADRVQDLLYQKYLKAFITYENITRVETYPFPKMAVREAIFNALAHSDWSANNPIQIRVEDDRLFISNSCLLTEGWTAETLLSSHQSLLLNPNIANTFFRAGFIEAWGRGIEKMCKACRNYGSPEPVYIIHPCDLMVRFDAAPSVMPFIEAERRKAEAVPTTDQKTDQKTGQKTGQKTDQKVQLTDLQQKVLDFLGANPTATRDTMNQVLQGYSASGIKYAVARLQEMKLLKRIGGRKNGHWEVIDQQQ